MSNWVAACKICSTFFFYRNGPTYSPCKTPLSYKRSSSFICYHEMFVWFVRIVFEYVSMQYLTHLETDWCIYWLYLLRDRMLCSDQQQQHSSPLFYYLISWTSVQWAAFQIATFSLYILQNFDVTTFIMVAYCVMFCKFFSPGILRHILWKVRFFFVFYFFLWNMILLLISPYFSVSSRCLLGKFVTLYGMFAQYSLSGNFFSDFCIGIIERTKYIAIKYINKYQTCNTGTPANVHIKIRLGLIIYMNLRYYLGRYVSRKNLTML